MYQVIDSLTKEILDLTDVDNVTLFTMLNALQSEHVALAELYRKEEKDWTAFETNFRGSEQGHLISSRHHQLTCVIEELSEIINGRRNK